MSMPHGVPDEATASRPSAATWHRAGAVFYGLWGALHVFAAFLILPDASAGLQPGVTLARVQQNSVFMATVGVAAIWIAIRFNRRGDRFGYWFNLYLVSAADLGFVLLVLLPGHEALPRGLIGPALWIAAVAASTVGMLAAKSAAGRAPV